MQKKHTMYFHSCFDVLELMVSTMLRFRWKCDKSADTHRWNAHKNVMHFQCLFDFLELMISKMLIFRKKCDKSEDTQQWN